MKKKSLLLTILSLALTASFGCGLVACTQPQSPAIETTTLKLDRDNIQLLVGETTTITAMAQEGESLSYSSTNEAVVTVSQTGEVKALSSGSAFIVVVAGTETKSCLVTVAETAYTVQLSCLEMELVAGATNRIEATVLKNGAECAEKVTFTMDGDAVTLTPKENAVEITAVKTGIVTVKAQVQKATAICRVKVMNAGAQPLEMPVLSSVNCDKITWTAVPNATEYAVKINDGAWERTTDTYISCAEQANELEKYSVCVRALADSSIDFYDSDVASISVEHTFIRRSGDSATCVTFASATFECDTCKRSYVEDQYYAAHTYINGICSVCNTYQTLNLPLIYNEEADGYILEKCEGILSPHITEITVPASYDDGVNGIKPVVGLVKRAFKNLRYLEKVVLPDTITSIPQEAFVLCKSLKTVHMTGVKGNFGFTGGNEFLDCNNLTNIVVSPDFTTKTLVKQVEQTDENGNKVVVEVEGEYVERQIFLARYVQDKEYYPKLTVFVKGSAVGADFYATRSTVNNQFTGKVVLYDENATCGSLTWKYDENGDIFYEEHNFSDGVCTKCGATDSEGLSYEYDEELDGYVLLTTGAGFTGNAVMPKAQYNDGKNGLKNVVAIQDSAFANCPALEKVVLPDTITKVRGNRGNIFMQCYALRYVDLGGIQKFTGGGNEFLDCFKLRTLVVCEGFQVKSSEQRFLLRNRIPSEIMFKENCIDYAGTMDVYVKSENSATTSIAISAKNNLYSGNIYFYSQQSTCEKWGYNKNGEAYLYKTHDYGNGESCQYCSLKKAVDILYKYDQAMDGYVVLGFVDDYQQEILNFDYYDDGIHGEKPVVAIGARAFQDNTTITKVIMPRTVTSIGQLAFEGCTALTYVQMEGVASMSSTEAFNNCSALRTIIVGKMFEATGRNFWSNKTTAGQLDLYVSDYVNGIRTNINLQPCFAGSSYNEGHSRNDLFSLKVYFLSADTATAGGWTYVDGIAKANSADSYYQITGANTFINPTEIITNI